MLCLVFTTPDKDVANRLRRAFPRLPAEERLSGEALGRLGAPPPAGSIRQYLQPQGGDVPRLILGRGRVGWTSGSSAPVKTTLTQINRHKIW